jgi:hypothetical protein
MGAKSKTGGFGGLRWTLLKRQPAQLVQIIGELYRLSRENQRFLEARLDQPKKQLPAYRQLIAECLYPDPLGRQTKIRIAEAKRAISQYERAARDITGAADLMLTFVERGTAYALDLGYGDEGLFSSLAAMLSRVLDARHRGSEELRRSIEPRLIRLSSSARTIGWGYGDFVEDAITEALESDE